MMKILFVHPASTADLKIQSGLRYPPLGIAFISAAVRNAGYTVRIFDANVEKKPFVTLRALIKDYSPDIVGISFTSLLWEGARYTAECIKTWQPETVIVAGGYHPTVMPKEVMQDYNFDFTVIGEGEETFLEWLRVYEANAGSYHQVKGLVFRQAKELVFTQTRPLIADLDSILFPAYDLLPLRRYSSLVSTRLPYVTFIRSRGCPFQCTFCGVQKMFGYTYRCQTPQKTISEIDTLMHSFRVREILFKDSDFLINRSNVLELCENLIRKKYDLIWSCNVRVDMVDKEILRSMKQAGCAMITFGVESGNQEILNRLKKGFQVEQIKNAVRLTKQAKIKVTVNIIFGGPGETRDTVRETMNLIKSVDPDYGNFAYLTAFPGSSLFDEALRNQWFIDGKPNSFGYESLKLNAAEMPYEELKQVLRNATKSFYLRPEYICKRLRHLSIPELRNNLKGLWSILRNC